MYKLFDKIFYIKKGNNFFKLVQSNSRNGIQIIDISKHAKFNKISNKIVGKLNVQIF